MDAFLELVKSRRSIRRFEPKTVEEDKIETILEAARWSPSWANTQCGEIIVVREPACKQELATLLSPKNPASLAVANGPIVLAICGKTERSGFYKGQQSTKFGDWMLFDLGIVTQTICLTAHSLGLGSVIVGAFEHERVKELLKIPAGYEVVSLIPVGYPDQSPSPTKRKDMQDFVHKEYFENKTVK